MQGQRKISNGCIWWGVGVGDLGERGGEKRSTDVEVDSGGEAIENQNW